MDIDGYGLARRPDSSCQRHAERKNGMKKNGYQLLGCVWLWAAVLVCGCGSPSRTAVWNEAESYVEKTENSAEEEKSGAEETGGHAEETGPEESIVTVPEETEGRENSAEEPNGSIGGEEDSAAAAERPKVRGIYVTGAMAGTANMDNLIDLVERTELNALVIDIKNDEGYVVCDMEVPMVQEIGSVKRYVRDMPALVQKCKEKNIYLIARIVAFKDPFLAEAKPEWSLHNADGTVFRDKDGLAWVNPYEEQVWDYLVEIAEGSIDLGFDEVQFDYIRFSTDKGMSQVDFGADAHKKAKEDVITEFAAYAAQRIHEKGAAVSADVYGVVIDSRVDQQIVGQNYMDLAQQLDYLSPMVYPSHYGPNNYNIPIPDAQPYDTVLAAMQASKKVLSGVMKTEAENDAAAQNQEAVPGSVSGNAAPGSDVSGNDVSGNGIFGNDAGTEPETAEEMTAEEIAALVPADGVKADVRPWLQDFTASWVKGHIKYGPEQIREQIQAVYDAGYEEWILWNAANRYTEGGLSGPEGQQGGE